MDINQLEYNLDKGNSLGFNIEKNEVVSWIILTKRKPINRFFELFDQNDDAVLYDAQIDILKNPYNLWIGEVTRYIYEGDKFPSNEDYILNYNEVFNSLEDVSRFLSKMNLLLSDIKWASEIEFL